ADAMRGNASQHRGEHLSVGCLGVSTSRRSWRSEHDRRSNRVHFSKIGESGVGSGEGGPVTGQRGQPPPGGAQKRVVATGIAPLPRLGVDPEYVQDAVTVLEGVRAEVRDVELIAVVRVAFESGEGEQDPAHRGALRIVVEQALHKVT